MASITAASITAFFLFDVAENIDLPLLQRQIGGAASTARFVPKSGAPSYLQYSVPPLVVDGEVVGIGEIDGFRARLKFFDYGVLSLALSRAFAGEWTELLALSQKYLENEVLEHQAESACRGVAERLGNAMTSGRAKWLSEDYVVLPSRDWIRR